MNIIANDGLNPRSRRKWQLPISGNLQEFTVEDKARLVEELRKIADDRTIRPLEFRAGSIVMLAESTQKAFYTIQAYYEEKTLSEKIGYEVLRDLHDIWNLELALQHLFAYFGRTFRSCRLRVNIR